jgi:arginyl-tRNA synthetase
VLQLLSRGDAMLAAEEKRGPNILCDYAFELAQRFSRFYAAHHILSETDTELRGARLGLCARTLGVLTAILGLLGIEVPQRM